MLQQVITQLPKQSPAALLQILDYKNETTFSGNMTPLSSADFHEFSRCLKKESRISCWLMTEANKKWIEKISIKEKNVKQQSEAFQGLNIVTFFKFTQNLSHYFLNKLSI